MSVIIKRFRGFPPCRLFVYNNLMRNRADHDHFLREGARFIGPAWVNGWGLYTVYYGNSIVAKQDIMRTLKGELYALPQRCLMWTDQIATFGMDRVCVHVNYDVPDKIAAPGGFTVIEKTHGAKGVETAWLHFWARPLPAQHRALSCLEELDRVADSED